MKQDQCPATVQTKFRRYDESIKLIRLNQTAKLHAEADDEKTTESIETAEKEFAMDLPLLVDETAEDAKILKTITSIANYRTDDIFYPISSMLQFQKWTKQQRRSGGRSYTGKSEKSQKVVWAAEPQVRTLEHKYRARD